VEASRSRDFRDGDACFDSNCNTTSVFIDLF
jgi:hypothetical protein